jgi:polysaccharide export outer membrane protein
MTSSRIRSFKSSLPRIAAALLLPTLLASAAFAQFAGPALPLSTNVNPTLVETTDPAILYPVSRDIKLDTDDTITVRIYNSLDYTPVARVSLDGTIDLPLVGLVAVRGLTIPEAQSLIATRLINAGMYRDPQVSIQITESPNQVATVIGEAHGVVPVGAGKRLFDVVSAAGGFPPSASHIITINRQGLDQPIIVNLGTDPSRSQAANIPIFPHDTIIVPRIGGIYLLGAFKNQSFVPLQQTTPLTLMKAAAIGGGPAFSGKYSDIRIIRTVGQTRTVVRVDYKKIVNGKAPDPVLEADDIVFLPTDALKSAIELGGVGTLLGVATILLYTLRN